MGAWLYQMNADVWSPEKYRKSVYEGKTLNWSVGRVYRRRRRIAPGDQVLLFFCESKNDEPGIYGLGEVERFAKDGDSGPRIRFAVKAPTDTLKAAPVWDGEVRRSIQAIRGKTPQGTMWRITPAHYARLREKILPRSSMDGVEARIRVAFRELTMGPSAPENTNRVKKALRRLGKRLGFTVYVSGDTGERVFDLCWRNEAGGVIHELVLASECEWAPGGVLVDFQKLVVSRAHHRLLVCTHAQPEGWQDCVSQLIWQVRHFDGTRNGDRYVFANWTSHGWDFKNYVHPGIVRESPRVWLFQAIPDDYDLEDEIRPGKIEDWQAVQFVDRLHAGDLALLWQTGKRAGVYGLAKLTTDVYERKGKFWVDLRYVGLCKPPILKREDLEDHPIVQDLRVIKMPRSRNPSRVQNDQWQALKKRQPLKRLLQRLGK